MTTPQKDAPIGAAEVEHVNLTVTYADHAAAELCKILGWHIRWRGESVFGGYTVHVGTEQSYLAIFAPGKKLSETGNSYRRKAGLNHIGILVEDLDAAEASVKAAGYEPHAHADYEPGRRFYFDFVDGVELELISYA